MTEFTLKKLKRKEQLKSNWGCVFCVLFLMAFWFGLLLMCL